MSNPSVLEDITSRKLQLQKWEHEYYVLDDPSVPDAVYDQIYCELKQLEIDNPELVGLDSPTQRVGGSPIDFFTQVTHKVPMLSLSNVFALQELIEFDSDISKLPGMDLTSGYVAENKWDGLAISLVYKNGVLVTAGTRGSGVVGENITHGIRTIKTIPLRLVGFGFPDVLEVRGEALMSKASFEKINLINESRGEKKYVNCRNAAAGALRNLDPKKIAERELSFFAYSCGQIEGGEMPSTHFETLQKFKEWGFVISEDTKLILSPSEFSDHIDAISNKRKSMPYDIDGIVFKRNSIRDQEKIGFTSKSLKWAKAYKFPPEEAVTKLIDVVFQTGFTGAVTPVGKLETVFVGGVNVSSVTLHNMDEIKRLGIRLNDMVIVARSGDVVPKLKGYVEDLRPEETRKIVMPATCPSCDGAIEKDPEQVAYRCTSGIECKAQTVGLIQRYVSRKNMNIDGFGDKLVELLHDKGMLNNFIDIYTLDYSAIEKMEGMGKKSVDKLKASIEVSKKTTLAKFLHSLGVRELGETTSRAVAEEFRSIEKLSGATKDELELIEDVGPVVSDHVASYFSSSDNLDMINKLIGLGITWNEEPLSQQNNSLEGSTYVVTGSFSNYKRDDIKDKLRSMGAKVSGSISKSTSYLIAGEKAGGKLAKAEILGVTIIGENELEELMGS